MPLSLFQIDAFTDVPFAGNPAAVVLLPRPAGAPWMQHVAREMNLSETAFVVPEADGFGLRWFTPKVEVDLCGHATLASAHALWESDALAPAAATRFHTRSGLLTARRQGGWIEMNFPSEPAGAGDAPPGLAEALGVTPVWVGRNRFDYVVEVDSPKTVRALAPDIPRLCATRCRGVMVTAAGDGAPYDFVSRFFAPWPASTRTRSPARRTAAWGHCGPGVSARRICSPTRRQPGAAWCASARRATGSSWAARR